MLCDTPPLIAIVQTSDASMSAEPLMAVANDVLAEDTNLDQQAVRHKYSHLVGRMRGSCAALKGR